MSATVGLKLVGVALGTSLVLFLRNKRVGNPPADNQRPLEATHRKTEQTWVGVTHDVLSLDAAVAFVGHPGAGAISTFSGTTRDNFKGKEVVRLEYECYTSMALREMETICNHVLNTFGTIRVALVHRLGAVDVGESSVIIAVSSVHRQEGLDATKYVIDTLKAKVPIWKKELYGGSRNESVWKENKEFNH